MLTTCPRCRQPFSCRPDAIHTCGCARLTLSPDTLARLRAYSEAHLGGYGCLCTDCLRELAETLTSHDSGSDGNPEQANADPGLL